MDYFKVHVLNLFTKPISQLTAHWFITSRKDLTVRYNRQALEANSVKSPLTPTFVLLKLFVLKTVDFYVKINFLIKLIGCFDFSLHNEKKTIKSFKDFVFC